MSPTRRPLPNRATTEARAAAPRRSARGRILEQIDDRASHRRRVADGHDDAGLAVGDDVLDAAGAGRDHGPARRHRLDQGDRRALVLRGQHHDVEVGVEAIEVGAPAEEADAGAEAGRARRRLELGRAARRRRRSGTRRPGRTGAIALAACQEHFVRLDRHQARDDADERRRRAAGPARARSSPRRAGAASSGSRSRPSGTTTTLIGAADPAGQDVAPDARRHGDERARATRQHALGRHHEAGLQRREIPSKTCPW